MKYVDPFCAYPKMFLLGLLFVVLKLTLVIECDWWLVLLPFYVTYATFLAVIILFLTFWLVVGALSSLFLMVMTVGLAIKDIVDYLLRR